jgi:hypothetical protein
LVRARVAGAISRGSLGTLLGHFSLANADFRHEPGLCQNQYFSNFWTVGKSLQYINSLQQAKTQA